MGPDPEKIHNGSNFEPHSEYIINQMDDEMEVDEQQNDGYFRLNLDNANEHYIPANDEETSDDDDDSADEEEENEFAIPESVHQPPEAVNLPNVPQIPSASSELVASVWNQKPSAQSSAIGNGSSNIELTSEKSQQITQIMSKISLPNAPNWLDELSSENILDRIKRRADADKH